MSRRIGIPLLVVVAASAAAPSAPAAKPKLYTVSFSGDVRSESSRVRPEAVFGSPPRPLSPPSRRLRRSRPTDASASARA